MSIIDAIVHTRTFESIYNYFRVTPYMIMCFNHPFRHCTPSGFAELSLKSMGSGLDSPPCIAKHIGGQITSFETVDVIIPLST